MGLMNGSRWGLGNAGTTDTGGTANVAPGALDTQIGGNYQVGGNVHVQFAAGWLIAIGIGLILYTMWVR